MSENTPVPSEKALLERITSLEEKVSDLSDRVKSQQKEESVCLVCFSGDWDKLFAAFTIANGALSLGQEVHLFFTFWAVSALLEPGKKEKGKKNIVQRMLQALLPGSSKQTPLSKMNFGGLSKVMLAKLMKEKGIDDLETLIAQARELGAHFYVCDTSAGLFGIECSELCEGGEQKACGVVTFLSLALKSRLVLFI